MISISILEKLPGLKIRIMAFRMNLPKPKLSSEDLKIFRSSLISLWNKMRTLTISWRGKIVNFFNLNQTTSISRHNYLRRIRREKTGQVKEGSSKTKSTSGKPKPKMLRIEELMKYRKSRKNAILFSRGSKILLKEILLKKKKTINSRSDNWKKFSTKKRQLKMWCQIRWEKWEKRRMQK